MGAVNRLSFDILGQIFSYHEDTIFNPLETFLLVNHAWKDAAVGHSTLWSRFNIWLGHWPTTNFWENNVISRFIRAGPTTPLEIDLRLTFYVRGDNGERSHPLDHPVYSNVSSCRGKIACEEPCYCLSKAQCLIPKILQVLVGQKGINCQRWVSFRVDLRYESLPVPLWLQYKIEEALSHDAPMLITLALENVDLEGAIALIPSSNHLKDLHVVDSTISSVPNLNSATHVYFCPVGPKRWAYSKESTIDLTPFKNATNLEELVLFRREIPWQLELPVLLPHLKSLTIGEYGAPTNLNEIQAPILRSLSLRWLHISQLQSIAHHRFIAQVEDLEIRHPTPVGIIRDTVHPELEKPFRDILASAERLNHFAGEKATLNIILKLFWELSDFSSEWIRRYTRRLVTFTLIPKGDSRTMVVVGENGKFELERTALLLGLTPPNYSWVFWWTYNYSEE